MIPRGIFLILFTRTSKVQLWQKHLCFPRLVQNFSGVNQNLKSFLRRLNITPQLLASCKRLGVVRDSLEGEAGVPEIIDIVVRNTVKSKVL